MHCTSKTSGLTSQPQCSLYIDKYPSVGKPLIYSSNVLFWPAIDLVDRLGGTLEEWVLIPWWIVILRSSRYTEKYYARSAFFQKARRGEKRKRFQLFFFGLLSLNEASSLITHHSSTKTTKTVIHASTHTKTQAHQHGSIYQNHLTHQGACTAPSWSRWEDNVK